LYSLKNVVNYCLAGQGLLTASRDFYANYGSSITMIQATDIIHDIIRLPVSQRMLIVEQVIRSIRHEERPPLEKAVECLYADYYPTKSKIVGTVF